jgi:hypothetical protein
MSEKIATKALWHKESQIRSDKYSFIPVMILLALIACSPKQGGKPLPENKMKGNWAFLDGNGNYNEAFFADSTFRTYNIKMGAAPVFGYAVRGDSLFTDNDKRRPGLHRIALVEWLNLDKVIFTTEFTKDTLERILGDIVTLETTDPDKDSVLFKTHITIRYENYLIAKGIITAEELEAYKKNKIIPKDIQENKGNNP